jgi:hypothetical protein
MIRPQTRYARSGDVNIAYQIVGDTPPMPIVWISWRGRG